MQEIYRSSMALSTVGKEIYKLLEDEGSATIALVGKSESGKTWLARKLSALAVRDGLFDSTIWLFLNREYHSKALLKRIAHQLSLFSIRSKYGFGDNMDILEFKEEEDEDKLVKMISDALEEKKILLVLDDEGNKMKKTDIDRMLSSRRLGIPGKVLVTSVNEDGSHNDLQPRTMIKAGSLSKDESMSLLRQRAGSETFETPLVKTLAEAFVERVMDQPAAIIVT